MAKHETFEQRRLKALDEPPARRKNEFFWRLEDLARHLQLGAMGAIRDWLARGLVTEADGWVKIGEMDRFISRVVKARIEAGLFGKGTRSRRKAGPARRVAHHLPITLLGQDGLAPF